MGLLIGLVFSIAFISIIYVMNSSIEHEESIEKTVPLPKEEAAKIKSKGSKGSGIVKGFLGCLVFIFILIVLFYALVGFIDG